MGTNTQKPEGINDKKLDFILGLIITLCLIVVFKIVGKRYTKAEDIVIGHKNDTDNSATPSTSSISLEDRVEAIMDRNDGLFKRLAE
jgi:hypothetical protein